MGTVTYEIEEAVFKFNLPDVEVRLRHYVDNHNVEAAAEILTYLSNRSGESIQVPNDFEYFAYVTLDLINAGKGTVACKSCDKTYKPGQLKPITIGYGESPFSIKPQPKERRFFRKKQNPSALGGKGYQCPKGHEQISMITWRT
jgi:hypothetical protein